MSGGSLEGSCSDRGCMRVLPSGVPHLSVAGGLRILTACMHHIGAQVCQVARAAQPRGEGRAPHRPRAALLPRGAVPFCCRVLLGVRVCDEHAWEHAWRAVVTCNAHAGSATRTRCCQWP